MAFLSVLLAFLYAVFAAILVKIISKTFLKKGKPYELGFFLSAVALAAFSIGILLLDTPFGTLNFFIKAGLTISILQFFMLPVLLVLKKTRKQTYHKFIQWFEQTL
ncbi:hypothetical protein [Robertmurraya sp. FSL R5-0851]|uniref:hypothetical protein n=1 Tax=Robertmurraya sp. FSL R5-0851 TaxID=2921584 RepID=UPI0030FA5439